MAREGIEVEAEVLEALQGGSFRVKIKDSDAEAIVTLSGKMRKNYIKVSPGDKVKVELSVYDLTKGRITYRR